MLNSRNLLVSAVTVALLAGCGGGGSDAGPSEEPGNNAATPNVTITSSNAISVAGGSTAAALAVTSSSDVLRETANHARSMASASGIAVNLQDALEAAALLAVTTSAGSGAAPRSVGHGGTPEACVDDGTFVPTLTDANNNHKLDVGETMSVQFFNCAEGGTTSNGEIQLTLNEEVGDPDVDPTTFKLVMTMALEGFAVTGGANAFSADGSVKMTVDNSPTASFLELDVPSLAVTEGDVTDRLTDFVFSATENLADSSWSLSMNGLVDASGVGVVRLVTVAPLAGIGDANPNAGSLRIEGAASSVTLLPQADAENVTLEVDSNGDGIADDTQTATWVDLGA